MGSWIPGAECSEMGGTSPGVPQITAKCLSQVPSTKKRTYLDLITYAYQHTAPHKYAIISQSNKRQQPILAQAPSHVV